MVSKQIHSARMKNITRGMFVTVLHRMENQPKTDMTNFGFTDVPEGFYYREAIGWASANGSSKWLYRHRVCSPTKL